MTPEKIQLVKSNWEKVAQISEQAAELFYGRLFELDPSLRSLFKGDMKEQGRKLMQMIGVAVANLHQLDQVLVPVQELGKRHVGYGVKDSQYETVGTALIWTLEQGLGEDFTPQAKESWIETYQTLSDVMKKAAATA